MVENNIDILALQETELDANCDVTLMSIPGYFFECEENVYKRRVGFYIRNSIEYKRCVTLEGVNNGSLCKFTHLHCYLIT